MLSQDAVDVVGGRVRVHLRVARTCALPHVAEEEGHTGTIIRYDGRVGNPSHAVYVHFDEPVEWTTPHGPHPMTTTRQTARFYAPDELVMLD